MEIKSGILALMFFLLPQVELKNINGKVISIKDGDTFTIKDQKDKLYKIRLSDIDAPEIGQPFGRPAKRLLEDLALNKMVRINYNQVDKYGRLIAEVFLPDGKKLNEESLKVGLAWHYRVKYPHSTFLEEMEYKAWKKTSILNSQHMLWAWVSMIWVALTDLYIMLVSRGVITDLNTWG